MKNGNTDRRRLLSRASVVVGLGLLATAAFLAVAHLTGGHAATTQSFRSSGFALTPAKAGKALPGEMTAGEGRESNEITARDKWFYGQRAFPNKHTPAGALNRAFKQTLALRRTSTDRASAVTWSRVGPNPIATIGPDASAASGQYGGALPLAGRVSAIAPAKSNPNIVYIGGANGGVWKTTNGGTSWATAWPNSMAAFSIGSIAVDPSNASNVWVGTGEANGSADSYYGQGIYHSTNGGLSWTKVGPAGQFDGCFVSGLAFVSSTTIVAGVLEFPGIANPACPTAKRGVWRTTNTGGVWSHISLPSSAYQAPNNFSQPPGSPLTIYLSTYIDGIYRSTNGGASFTKTSLTGGYREAVSAYSPTIAYATASAGSSGADFGGLFKTTTGGTSWSPVVTGSTTNTPCTYPSASSGQCWYDITIAADPTNSNRVFVGGIRVYRYTGSSGVPVGYGAGAGNIHVDQHATVFDNAHNMWEGSDGGAYRLPAASLASTHAFVNRNGSGSTALGITEFNGWTSGSIGGGTFIGGTQDNGTVKYKSSTGLNWRMDHGGDGGASAFINANTYFASYYGAAVFRTLNGGTSYSQVFNTSDPANFYPPMAQAPGFPNTMYRGTDRVWRTTNGTTWTPISPHFTGSTVSAVASEKLAAPAYVLAGISNSSTAVIKYTHNATAASPTWVSATGTPNRYVTDIWVNPTNHNNVIATFSGFGTGHVYRSTNGGASWVTMNGSLPNVPVNAVAVDPTNVNHVFLGTDTGVFYSANGTAGSPTWTSLNGTTLPNTAVTDISVDGSYLVAATHGRSAWRGLKP